MTSEEKILRIGFATELAMDHKAAWSGTLLHMMSALQQGGASLQTIGPIRHALTLFLNRTGKALRLVLGYDLMLNRTPLAAWAKGRVLQRKIREASVDVVFAPAGSSLIAYETSRVPIVHISDATVRLLTDYYAHFTGLPGHVLDRAIALETRALHRADLLIYPTQWAARSAIEDYGISPDKIVVQPFGANLMHPPRAEEVLDRLPSDRIHLLFCGVDWQRKGGHIALEALRHLRGAGHDAVLCVMGCTPDPADVTEDLRAHITVVPFLNKSVPADLARFQTVFRGSDFLLLPTRAECFGMVFCEAAAFGVVSITTRTGGTPEVVREGVTGFTLPWEATGADYAATIARALALPGGLPALRRLVRADFDARLNWMVWARAILPHVERLIRKQDAATTTASRT